MTHDIHCEMINEIDRECGQPAVAEVEGGPTCAKHRDACEKELLEILPLGTEVLYSAGKEAYDHAAQYEHNSTTDCIIKAVAAIVALNNETRSP